MNKIRTKKQIYQSTIIKDLSINYHLYFDKTKITSDEYLKLLNYLQPMSVIFDSDNNIIDFYKVKQRKELKLL